MRPASSRNGKGLGVVACDLDDDGDIDLYVANDTTPNFLYRNRGDGTFDEVGYASGAALERRGDRHREHGGRRGRRRRRRRSRPLGQQLRGRDERAVSQRRADAIHPGGHGERARPPLAPPRRLGDRAPRPRPRRQARRLRHQRPPDAPPPPLPARPAPAAVPPGAGRAVRRGRHVLRPVLRDAPRGSGLRLRRPRRRRGPGPRGRPSKRARGLAAQRLHPRRPGPQAPAPGRGPAPGHRRQGGRPVRGPDDRPLARRGRELPVPGRPATAHRARRPGARPNGSKSPGRAGGSTGTRASPPTAPGSCAREKPRPRISRPGLILRIPR